MRLVKWLLNGLGLLAVSLSVIGLLLPDNTHVERRIEIISTPAAIFALVNDLRSFNQWSPWARIDPKTRYTFSGPSAGVGARMAWASDNPNVGSGSQEIIKSEPQHRVELALDFGAQGNAVAYYDIEPAGDGVAFTWGFDSQFGYDLLGRYFGLMMDQWIGAEYEKGLRNLKVLAEKSPG
jgi:uncharacterized protein YndB with AHSA1/START domain